MAELIKTTDSLNDGRKKLNDAITDSNAALSTANNAEKTANLAKAESESTQTQLDTIVIEGDSSVEAAQARVNNSGTAFPTLKQRLDAEHQEVTAQLQQTEQSLNAQLAQKANDLYGRGINVMYPPVPMIGAKMDGVTDDTLAIQNIINYLSPVNAVGTSAVIIPNGIGIVSNLILTPSTMLVGLGRWNSMLKAKPGSTGYMITDNGNAAKIMIENLGFDANNCSYESVLRLGYNTWQFGTEGRLSNLFIRNCPNGIAYDINANVGNIDDIVNWTCKTGLNLSGDSNRVSKVVTLGNTAYGVKVNGGHNIFSMVEIEAPTSTCIPINFTSNDLTITGLMISLTSDTTFNHLINIDNPASNKINITGISVAKQPNASYENVVKHNGLPFLKSGEYEDYSFNYITDELQYLRLTESFVTTLADRINYIDVAHPSILFSAEGDLTDDVVIRFNGVNSQIMGKHYVIQNNSQHTVYVRGINSKRFLVGNQNVNYDINVGFPVRKNGRLDIYMSGGHVSNVIAQHSGTYGDIVNYPTTGKWYEGEVIYNNAISLKFGDYAKVCTRTGDYGTTSLPEWKSIGFKV